MHGGIGVTWDHDLHLYLRRVVSIGRPTATQCTQRDQVAILADQDRGTTMTVTTTASGGAGRRPRHLPRAEPKNGSPRIWSPSTAPTPTWDTPPTTPTTWCAPRPSNANSSTPGSPGCAIPVEYGGRGLPAEYQDAFIEVSYGYELPRLFNTPTFTIILPTILDFGTEEQKQRFIPAALKGEELWVQFLSEPTGGSDLAGALTRADRAATSFVLNGSKIWSTYAWKSDYALCVARTTGMFPSTRGSACSSSRCTSRGSPSPRSNTSTEPTTSARSSSTTSPVPADQVLGQVDDGWNVASRLLLHEREAISGSSPYAMAPRTAAHENDQVSAAARSRRTPAARPTPGCGN